MTHETNPHHHQDGCCNHDNEGATTATEKSYLDPVCGMQVSKDNEKMAMFQGVAYYFCSLSCKDKFNANPGAYVKAKKLVGQGSMSASAPASLPAAQTNTAANAKENTKAGSCCGSGDEMVSDAQGGHMDPVCGMRVNEQSRHQFTYDAKTYYFCCASCLEKFRKDPAAWLNPAKRQPPKALASDAVYTCPMHPEVEQIGPGACPLCGMALEPKEASAEEDTSELDDMTRRFKISLALCLPLLALTMGDALPGISLHHLLGMTVFNWLQFALSAPVVVWAGLPFF